MSPRAWRTQALLAVSLLLLGTFAYWWEFSHRPKNEDALVNEKKLFQLKGRPIKKFEIVYAPPSGTSALGAAPSGRDFAFACKESDPKHCDAEQAKDWDMVQPVKQKADGANISSFLSALSNLQVSETVSLDDETPEKQAIFLKEYELEETQRAKASHVILQYQDGTSQTLWLGAVHPNGDKQYALRSDAPQTKISMIPSFFKSNLDHDQAYWRDKKILQFSVFDVASFELQSSKGNVSGEKKEGLWTLSTSAGKVPGDLEAIESILGAVASLSAIQFVADDQNAAIAKKTLAESSRVGSLEVTDKSQKAVTVKLFENSKTRKQYVTLMGRPGTVGVYEVANILKDRVFKSAKDLRLAKLLTSIERYSVKKIELKSGTKEVVIQSKDAKWFFDRGGKLVDAPSEPVQDLLDGLSGNRIKDFVMESSLSSEARSTKANEKDSLHIQLSGEGASVHKRYLLWRTKTEFFVQDLDSPRKGEVFKVDFEASKKIPWTLDLEPKGNGSK